MKEQSIAIISKIVELNIGKDSNNKSILITNF